MQYNSFQPTQISPIKLSFWILALLAAAAYLCAPLTDPDLWWHITVGRWILAHNEIPRVDYWNYFGHGQLWRAYSWSIEILFAAVELPFGLSGLLVVKLLLAIALAFSLGFCFSKISCDYAIGGMLGVFCTLSTFNHFTLRPQAFVWIYFAWLILLLDNWRSSHSKGQILLGIGLLMMLWANTHLSSILGLLLIFAWIAAEQRRCMPALLPTLVGFAGTLVTPYFGGEWLTFLAKADHPFIHSGIAEFQPATINQYSTAFLLILFVLLLLLVHHRPKLLDGALMLLGSTFVFGALAVVKFIPFAVLLTAALCARCWRLERQQFEASSDLVIGIDKLAKLLRTISSSGWSLLLSLLLLASSASSFYASWRSKLAYDFVPAHSLDFILKKQLPLPLLHSFGDGGYVMYRYSDRKGNPGYLVPIDGRTNVTPPEVLEEHQYAFAGTQHWQRYIDRIKPKTILWLNASPLSAILKETGEWCLVFRNADPDKGHAVFVRRDYWEQHREELPAENCG